MAPYRFLLDRDVQAAADALPPSRVLTLAKVGLPDTASDEDIIHEACQRRSIIVTANGRDFVHKAVAYIKQSSLRKQGRCRDLNGLVVLPSGLETQRRLLREAPQRMWYDRPITWLDVWWRSYYVRFKRSGRAEVSPLPRCQVCASREIGRSKRKTKGG
jgi:hypothetical protein